LRSLKKLCWMLDDLGVSMAFRVNLGIENYFISALL
jgi:hypothetical protein